MAKVTFEFDMHEDNEDIRVFQEARKLYNALWDIDSKCRSLMKYDERVDDFMYEQLDQISGLIHEAISCIDD